MIQEEFDKLAINDLEKLKFVLDSFGKVAIRGMGAKGLDGKTVLNGTVDPTTEGVNGDFYLNTTTTTLFGPKTAGAWGTGVLLKGTDGTNGTNGIDGLDINWLGNYNAGTTYAINDTVLYNSKTYICILASTGNLPTNTTYWNIMVDNGGTALPVYNILNETPDREIDISNMTLNELGNLVGTLIEDIKSGLVGPNGLDGKTVLNGTVDPTTEGVNGDFYLNTTTTTLFGPKTAGAWGTGTSLIGAPGTPGADGASGTPGADGAPGTPGVDGIDGNTVLNGTVDPTTEGVNGDFYLNTISSTMFGPKTAGVWGTGTLLKGADGINGINGTDGTNGNTVLNGTIDPTTQGVNGDFYLNTTSSTIFGPKTAGAWGTGVLLKGADGTNGTNGQGVPTGGTAGQILTKVDSTDFNTAWGYVLWVGTQARYDAIVTKDSNTIYFITA